MNMEMKRIEIFGRLHSVNQLTERTKSLVKIIETELWARKDLNDEVIVADDADLETLARQASENMAAIEKLHQDIRQMFQGMGEEVEQ